MLLEGHVRYQEVFHVHAPGFVRITHTQTHTFHFHEVQLVENLQTKRGKVC